MNKKFSYILITFFVLSCSSKKDILYLQDLESNEVYSSKYITYKVKIDDILKIDVSSERPETALIFNPKGGTTTFSNSKENFLLNGYQVNSEGKIIFPVLGEITVINLTTSQIRDLIYNSIIENGVLIDLTVDVKIINSHFTILGEVQRPGRYDFLKNNLNILEAIGMAGDLTINGERENIKLIRELGNNKTIYTIDLKKSDLLDSDYYQIFSGDIIVVNPNATRVKNAGIIGNSGTLISLLSFLLSSIIVISSNN